MVVSMSPYLKIDGNRIAVEVGKMEDTFVQATGVRNLGKDMVNVQ